MKQFLFSARGRFNRAKFWKAILYYIAAGIIVSILALLLSAIIPSQATEDGTYSVTGVAAIPYLILIFGYFIALIWYFVETGFLTGTPGPNRFGPDPLAR